MCKQKARDFNADEHGGGRGERGGIVCCGVAVAAVVWRGKVADTAIWRGVAGAADVAGESEGRYVVANAARGGAGGRGQGAGG